MGCGARPIAPMKVPQGIQMCGQSGDPPDQSWSHAVLYRSPQPRGHPWLPAFAGMEITKSSPLLVLITFKYPTAIATTGECRCRPFSQPQEVPLDEVSRGSGHHRSNAPVLETHEDHFLHSPPPSDTHMRGAHGHFQPSGLCRAVCGTQERLDKR